ncbi:hypothetical protein [Streptomyces sp. NPDC017940]|uniref:hypothetical protein n=1 Tax=Streptomyces sp. NPDC017940 TaxID=3365017 RepID=UPI0037B015C6
MTGDRWTSAVRRQLGLGRVLPLGGAGDGAWLTESAARVALLGSAERVAGARVTGLRVGPAGPTGERGPAKGYVTAVPAPPSALPPGPLRISADFTAGTDEPLPAVATRLRTALGTAAAERLGLEVAEVDLRVTGLSERRESPEPRESPGLLEPPPELPELPEPPPEPPEPPGEGGAGASEPPPGKDGAGAPQPPGKGGAGAPKPPGKGAAGPPEPPELPETPAPPAPSELPTPPTPPNKGATGTPNARPATTPTPPAHAPARPPAKGAFGEAPPGGAAPSPGGPEGQAPTPGSDEGRVTRACLAVPGVTRMAGTLGGLGGAVHVTERSAPHALPRRHVRVELAADIAHRTLDVARAVRAAVTEALPDHPTVAVLITSLEQPSAEPG